MKIEIQKAILRENDDEAKRNAEFFKKLGLTVVNVMASPGAGKTTLILQLAKALRNDFKFGVIEGDLASRVDADKVAAAGIPVVQINTDGGCHLDAPMIAKAMGDLKLKGPGFLFIENIGNLICPTEFDLGENLRMVISSFPEGHDKPLKYPGIFASADLIVINKIDLQPHLDFDMGGFTTGIRLVNEEAPIFEVSGKTGSGLSHLVDWLKKAAGKK